jgi:hypothetical protein
MPSRTQLQKPIKPASVLYRALQQIAREVAKTLEKEPSSVAKRSSKMDAHDA